MSRLVNFEFDLTNSVAREFYFKITLSFIRCNLRKVLFICD